ncbi:DUF3093 family protein [Streptomyces sp. NPDC057236]|uniref:DUF3093 family protein n=1 Tax=Streptomyces sp. NPDC057236 TaxID=3346059 RepID=UPI003636B97E
MRLYEERLGVPRTWFWLAAPPGAMAALVLSPLAAAGGPAVVVVLTALGPRAYGAARIVVTDGHLTAGSMRPPVTSLGMTGIPDAEEAFPWRPRRADGRAAMLLRSYVPTAVRIEIDDPGSPEPCLCPSTRQPVTFFAVLSFARR